jgi:nicotinamide-nucleotide amidase
MSTPAPIPPPTPPRSGPAAGTGTGWPPTGHSWPGGADTGPGDPATGGGAGLGDAVAGGFGDAAAGVRETGSRAVLAALVRVGATVAVAESLTGGLLTAALTEPAGASKAVRGGLVVYATDLKATLAGVPSPLLDAEGAVSPDVAGALAAGARDRLGATYGLGVTGVAGPDPQAGQPVGTVYVALAGPGGGCVRQLMLTGDRAGIRAGAVAAAMDLLLSVLRERSPESPE